MLCLGFEPGSAGLLVQTDPLNYGCRKNRKALLQKELVKFLEK